MSKIKTITSLESVLHAWDMYAAGDFEGILSHNEYLESTNTDLRDLRLLAELEVDGRAGEPSGDLFPALVRGMTDYYRGDLKKAAAALGSWLVEKEYHTKLILDRFLECARATGGYDLAYLVLKKFVKFPAFKDRLAEVIIATAHHAEMHREALTHYKEYHALVKDDVVIQKVALSMIKLGMFREAERILIALFEKLSGHKYSNSEERFEEIRSKYNETIKVLEKKKNGSSEDVMELGMAYLFSGRYDEALRLFKTLKRAA
ncbi:MAG: hypothetical protein K8S54_21530 [Spirochaetia bacterium]|nr:hypothetical protein [Spirochaetia bacterium]